MESIQHETLEREIKDLAHELSSKHALESSPEKSKDAIRSVMSERIYGSPLPPTHLPSSSSINATPQATTLPDYAQTLSKEIKMKVEELLDLAWHKGISAAVSKVKKTDPLTMDVFHDAITDKLYQEFKKRKILS